MHTTLRDLCERNAVAHLRPLTLHAARPRPGGRAPWLFLERPQALANLVLERRGLAVFPGYKYKEDCAGGAPNACQSACVSVGKPYCIAVDIAATSSSGDSDGHPFIRKQRAGCCTGGTDGASGEQSPTF